MAKLEDTKITSEIAKRFLRDLLDVLEVDVAIVGTGPSGLTAARYLSREGAKVAVFERNFFTGGGMWSGAIFFPRIIFQDAARNLLKEIDIKFEDAGEGYYTADSVEAVAKCTSAAIDAGAKIIVGMAVEDVMIREKDRVAGVVVNWGAVKLAGLHVDPIGIGAKVVIDATGHDAEIARIVERKIPGAKFPTKTGRVMGEKPMWAEVGEKEILDNAQEIYPGLIVTGMAATAVFGSPRMGAIFTGVLLSGREAANQALRILKRKR